MVTGGGLPRQRKRWGVSTEQRSGQWSIRQRDMKKPCRRTVNGRYDVPPMAREGIGDLVHR